jgi:hypothetical protein
MGEREEKFVSILKSDMPHILLWIGAWGIADAVIDGLVSGTEREYLWKLIIYMVLLSLSIVIILYVV